MLSIWLIAKLNPSTYLCIYNHVLVTALPSVVPLPRFLPFEHDWDTLQLVRFDFGFTFHLILVWFRLIYFFYSHKTLLQVAASVTVIEYLGQPRAKNIFVCFLLMLREQAWSVDKRLFSHQTINMGFLYPVRSPLGDIYDDMPYWQHIKIPNI